MFRVLIVCFVYCWGTWVHDVGKFYAGEFFEKSWQVTTSEASCGDDYRDVVKDITWVVDGPRREKKKPDQLAVTPMENYALEKIRQLPEGVIVYTFLNQTGNNAGERWCYEITLEDQNTAVQLNTSTGSVRKLHRHTPDTLPVLRKLHRHTPYTGKEEATQWQEPLQCCPTAEGRAAATPPWRLSSGSQQPAVVTSGTKRTGFKFH